MFDFIPTECVEVEAYGQRLRITMRAVGSLGHAKFDEIRVKLLGKADELDGDENVVNLVNYRRGRSVYRTAALFVSLTSMERMAGDAWQAMDKPTDYTALGDLPDDVLAQCEAVYCRLNPDLFVNYAEFEKPDTTDETAEQEAVEAEERQKKDATPTESA